MLDSVKVAIKYALEDMKEAYYLSGYSKTYTDDVDDALAALAAINEQPQPSPPIAPSVEEARWEPLEDGEYIIQRFGGTYTLLVSYDGEELEMWSNADSNQYKDGTPKDIEEIGIGDYRLCRLTPASATIPSQG